MQGLPTPCPVIKVAHIYEENMTRGKHIISVTNVNISLYKIPTNDRSVISAMAQNKFNLG